MRNEPARLTGISLFQPRSREGGWIS